MGAPDTLTVQQFLASPTAMERLPKEAPHGTAHDNQRPDVGLDSYRRDWPVLAHQAGSKTRERRKQVVTWAEEPTPREWAFHAVCSQLRADQRRLAQAQERREFWRVMRCDLAAFAGVLVTMAVCYAVAWGLFALVGR